ncbi:MAG TPA: hypothetical protein VN790_09790 [Steroidobacteraceae bacterium]|nr:hypothetical protein [Steroidobacteraceae bacterium]
MTRQRGELSGSITSSGDTAMLRTGNGRVIVTPLNPITGIIHLIDNVLLPKFCLLR